VLLVVIVTIWASLGLALRWYVADLVTYLEMCKVKDKTDVDYKEFYNEFGPLRDALPQTKLRFGGQEDKATIETIDAAKEQVRIASYKAALEESRRKDKSAQSQRDNFFTRVCYWLNDAIISIMGFLR